jgi:glutathione S-transferase
VLEETGAPLEIRKVERDARGESLPDYLAVNPLGRVPSSAIAPPHGRSR